MSRIVPEPITRLGDSADVASVAHVSTSTGFVVISRMASGARDHLLNDLTKNLGVSTQQLQIVSRRAADWHRP